MKQQIRQLYRAKSGKDWQLIAELDSIRHLWHGWVGCGPRLADTGITGDNPEYVIAHLRAKAQAWDRSARKTRSRKTPITNSRSRDHGITKNADHENST